MATENQALSPKAKENLQKNAELRQKDNKFIKLQPSEKRVLQFNAEKIEQTEAEFNGRKTQRYRYTVTEPNNGSQEKYLEVGKRTSEDIDSNLSEGHTLLKIQRFGLGKDTRYH
jgi:hypothetical protein